MAIITVTGRIGKDGAQIKKFKEKEVIVFSLAEDAFIKGEQKTIWYDIYLNNARNPEKLSEALKQGRLIMVNGTLRVGTWTTNSGNVLLQQSINVEGLPFIVTKNSKEALRQQAIAQLMLELKKGEESVKSEADWLSEEDVLERLEVK